MNSQQDFEFRSPCDIRVLPLSLYLKLWIAGGISVYAVWQNLVDFPLSAMTQYAIKRLNWQKFSPNVPLPTKWDCFLLFFINKTWRENMNNFFTQVKTNFAHFWAQNKFKISYIFRFFVCLVFFWRNRKNCVNFSKRERGKTLKNGIELQKSGLGICSMVFLGIAHFLTKKNKFLFRSF